MVKSPLTLMCNINLKGWNLWGLPVHRRPIQNKFFDNRGVVDDDDYIEGFAENCRHEKNFERTPASSRWRKRRRAI